MENDYVIQMLNITKKFPGIIANDNITFELKRGEIHALLGENGAGKSTLMSVLFGLYQPEEGQIIINGNPVKINDPNDAKKYGIGMVHQHFKLVECFTVLDNIILGDEDQVAGFVNKKASRQKVENLIAQYGLAVNLDDYISDITVGQQQRVEILKMLYRDNDILIFDEPTAVLTPQEIDELMAIMKHLKDEGKSLIFISHKLNEIKAVCDRCTVLRKGKYIGTVDTASTTIEELSEMMVGRAVKLSVDKTEANPLDVVLDVKNIVVKSKVHKKNSVNNVSINVRKGEIVCIAGIEGNGQTEFVNAITGLDKIESGEIYLLGERIDDKNIRYRNTHGIAHITEDRHKYGLILDFTLEQNLVLQRYFEPEFQKHGFIRFDKTSEYADRLIEEYDIRSSKGGVTVARSMSGGNQQKAIVAREMDREHSLLVAFQPTRGLDVGAIESIHEKIVKKRDNGDAVLLVSLELDEVMNLSDRIYVMYEGEIVGEFKADEITVQELGLYMSGAKRQTIKEEDHEGILQKDRD